MFFDPETIGYLGSLASIITFLASILFGIFFLIVYRGNVKDNCLFGKWEGKLTKRINKGAAAGDEQIASVQVYFSKKPQHLLSGLAYYSIPTEGVYGVDEYYVSGNEDRFKIGESCDLVFYRRVHCKISKIINEKKVNIINTEQIPYAWTVRVIKKRNYLSFYKQYTMNVKIVYEHEGLEFSGLLVKVGV